MAKHTPPPGWINPLAPQLPLTSLGWIAGALTATLLFAVLCVYCTFCLLFWQGQWQLVFHPTHALTATPASAGIAYDNIQFDATETGTLQLNGWWIAADPGAPFANSTLLLMHDGTGSLSDTVPQIQVLHQMGINVFAFDYRGFGKSVDLHPSEKSTYDDAQAAYRYLVETRHLPPSSIVLDGIGLGAAIAAETAQREPQAAALILEAPARPVLQTLQLDRRTRLLPISLLFHDRFDARKTLAGLHIPRLVLPTTVLDPFSLGRLQAFLSQSLSLLSLPTTPTQILTGAPFV
jgi:pimeloyl-ACP methyl ester carboxylesterase